MNALQSIKDKLAKRNLSGWQIRETRRTSHQSFLAKEERECVRTVHTTVYSVSVYQKRANGKGGTTLGLSTFSLSPKDLDGLDEKIDQALFSAGLVKNQPFELQAQPAGLPSVEIFDAALDKKTPEACEERLLRAVRREKNIRLSAAEFFVDVVATRLINHLGLDVKQEESDVHTEFILLAKNNGEEKEFINRYTRRYLQDFDIEGEVALSSRYAREATEASLPETGSFPVILSEEPLDNIFKPLIAKASARLKYNKMIEAEKGRSVVADGPVQGDRITLWTNGHLERMLGSTRFDSFGTPSTRTCLIKDNILSGYLADKRYGEYLNIPVTGELGNVEVQEGGTAFADLFEAGLEKSDTVYHLTAFSAFEPNAITGAFSAEIRSGYQVTKKGVTPIKGGSVSGVLHKDLLNCRLAKERVQRERALVPSGLLFESLAIAGR